MSAQRCRLAAASRAACVGLLLAPFPQAHAQKLDSVAAATANGSMYLAAVNPFSGTSSSISAYSATPAFEPGDDDASQPPPRRYGRPTYTDRNSNPDGSAKYTYFAGIGASLPIGNTHAYETPGYSFQIGAGRNFNQSLGMMFQFDYDHFGLQAQTLANQVALYGYCTQAVINAGECPAPITNLDGNNHVWSFTLYPKFTLPSTGILGAYAVIGGGFYHKVTNFTEPTTAEQCGVYGCGYYAVDANVDHYTSNAGGVNGGIGFTIKMSEFSTGQLYLEARYVLMLNQQRPGYTAQNVAITTYSGYNAYPANSHRTTYIPITFGFRF